MAGLRVQKVLSNDDRSLPVFQQMDELMRQIRDRAFQLCEGRGSGDGHALDDWLAAERELCRPGGELVEREQDFLLRLALPGYAPDEITVTATPHELIVRAATQQSAPRQPAQGETVCWSEFHQADLYRHVEMPAAIDVEKVAASVSNGLLTVTAPKQKTQECTVPVTAVA